MADTHTLQRFYTCTFESDDSDTSYDPRKEEDFDEEEWLWKSVKEEVRDSDDEIRFTCIPDVTAGISLTESKREAMYAAEDALPCISSTADEEDSGEQPTPKNEARSSENKKRT